MSSTCGSLKAYRPVRNGLVQTATAKRWCSAIFSFSRQALERVVVSLLNPHDTNERLQHRKIRYCSIRLTRAVGSIA
jgi:hypothetical protein